MPDSPFYARLEAVAHLNHEDSGASDLEKLRSHLETAKELVAKVKENPGFTGQIKSAIGEKLSSYIAGFELQEQNLTTLRSNHEEACRAMAEAKNSFGSLSPALLSPAESALQSFNETVSWAGITLPTEEYLTGVANNRNAEREQQANAALTKMNAALHKAAALDIAKGDKDSDSGGSGGGAGGSGGSNSPYSHNGSPSPSSGAGHAGAPGLASAVAAGAIPIVAKKAKNIASKIRSGSDGILRRALNPLHSQSFKDAQWPRDALKYPIGARMTPDGPVGGYLPPDVTNPDDPRWRADFSHPALGGAATGVKAGGVIGGILGVGTLAARGAGGLATQAIGSTAGLPTTGVAGSSSAGVANSSMAGSTLRPGGAGMSDGYGAGGYGYGAAGYGAGGYGYGAAGARNSKKGDKKSRDLVGYQVVRIDDEAAAAPVDPSLFGAGDVSSLRPMETGDNDSW